MIADRFTVPLINIIALVSGLFMVIGLMICYWINYFGSLFATVFIAIKFFFDRTLFHLNLK